MFVVFKRSLEGKPETIEVSDQMTAIQIDPLVGGVNWFGSRKANAEEAIAQANACGFRYGSPKEMLKLYVKALSLGEQASAHERDQH
jgi:hypothetical protein